MNTASVGATADMDRLVSKRLKAVMGPSAFLVSGEDSTASVITK